jgi:lipid-A-disaccharide synthase
VSPSGPSILIVAGDASGELHAAAVARELRLALPGVRLLGLGGAEMEKAGVEIVVPQREIAIGGLVEVARDAGKVLSAWRRLGRTLAPADGERPALAILVDSPDFCIPFARRARRAGVPVLYFISPQVWAWRRYRISKLARRVDRMAAIFPFEPREYAGSGLRVEFVGHPLVDRIAPPDPAERAGARARLGLGDGPLVALLPGSRRNELAASLPLQLGAARLLHESDPRIRFALALAPSLERADLDARLAELPEARGVPLTIYEGATYDVVRAADVVVTKPGTATVEIALLGTPLVVAARANPLTAWLARRVVRLPSLTMVNLIAGEPVVPELIQEDARPERLAAALRELLGPAGQAQRLRLAEVRERLGGGGTARRVAAIAREMIGAPVPGGAAAPGRERLAGPARS